MNSEGLYIAYGSNLNLKQMKIRCPTAKVVGAVTLHNWRLRFRGGRHSAVATIEREKGFKVPTLIWRLQPSDERSLDRYEGFPVLYRKETLQLTVNGRRFHAMAYIMNGLGCPCAAPSMEYLCMINEGYLAAGFDNSVLLKAANEAKEVHE